MGTLLAARPRDLARRLAPPGAIGAHRRRTAPQIRSTTSTVSPPSRPPSTCATSSCAMPTGPAWPTPSRSVCLTSIASSSTRFLRVPCLTPSAPRPCSPTLHNCRCHPPAIAAARPVSSPPSATGSPKPHLDSGLLQRPQSTPVFRLPLVPGLSKVWRCDDWLRPRGAAGVTACSETPFVSSPW